MTQPFKALTGLGRVTVVQCYHGPVKFKCHQWQKFQHHFDLDITSNSRFSHQSTFFILLAVDFTLLEPHFNSKITSFAQWNNHVVQNYCIFEVKRTCYVFLYDEILRKYSQTLLLTFCLLQIQDIGDRIIMLVFLLTFNWSQPYQIGHQHLKIVKNTFCLHLSSKSM